MAFWANFWGVMLLSTMIVFGILAVVVAVGGFFDVKKMFRQLEQRNGTPDEQQDS